MPNRLATTEREQADYLQQYRRELEKNLSQITNRAVDQWLKDSDKAFRDLLKTAIDTAQQEIYDELSSALNTQLSAAPGRNRSPVSSRLSNALVNFISHSINDALSSERTTITRRETERSQQSGETFRLSRSQHQAEAAKNAARGQRNL